MVGRIKLYNHWGFLEVDHEIGRYYRSLFFLTYGVKLQRPSNKEHITIISPEDYILLSHLHAFNDSFLNFSINNLLWTNGSCFWLDVISEDIEDFRQILGLSRKKIIPFHLAVGYLGD